ncbi:MAG: cytidylate kinase-like family protein, partial [Treponema sp.]|nr:cytidylate kinase-like family protein [Treponema sp.]
MPIITIARQYSSHGDEVGQELARLTGYKLINKHTLRSKIIEQGF